MGTEQQDILVTIRSTDKAIVSLQNRLEKYFYFGWWISKAFASLDAHEAAADALGKESDTVQRGRLIHELETHFVAAITFFLRCFLEQESTKLDITSVTKRPDLLDCFNEIKALRHDEFTHWKGLHSSVTVSYTFKPKGPTSYYLGNPIRYDFAATQATSRKFPLRALFQVTAQSVEEMRNKTIAQLQRRLEETDTLLTGTEILHESGESVLSRKEPQQ